MASELRGFTDPTSMQAFGNLVAGEQMYDQMAQQRAMQGQNALLAQQQMQQEYDLAQQRMAQGQQQFEAGLLEAGRAREFERTEREAGEEFTRKIIAERENRARQHELENERLVELKEQALARGEIEIAKEYDMRLAENQRQASDNAAQMTLISAGIGRTEDQVMQLIDQMSQSADNHYRVSSAASDAGKGMANNFITVLGKRLRDKNLSIANNLYASQAMQTGFIDAGLNFFGMGALKDVQGLASAASSELIDGLQYINLKPDAAATFAGMDPRQTPDASFVESVHDADSMARTVKQELSDSLVEAIQGLPGLKNLNQKALADAFSAFESGDSAKGNQLLVQSGVNPYTFQQLMYEAVGQFQKASERYNSGLASAMKESEGAIGMQRSLRSVAAEQARAANEARISILQRVAGRVNLTNLDALKGTIDRMAALRQRGEKAKGEGKLLDLAVPGADSMVGVSPDLLAQVEAGLLSGRKQRAERAALGEKQTKFAEMEQRIKAERALREAEARGRISKSTLDELDRLLGGSRR